VWVGIAGLGRRVIFFLFNSDASDANNSNYTPRESLGIAAPPTAIADPKTDLNPLDSIAMPTIFNEKSAKPFRINSDASDANYTPRRLFGTAGEPRRGQCLPLRYYARAPITRF
jgi:hypothetical protein